MMLHTNITSRLKKQLVGALIGVGAAGFLYITIEQMSSFTLQGLLVSPNTVSENAGAVVTNAEDADPSTLLRLARRAQSVVSQLVADEPAPSSENPLVVRAGQRGEARAALDSVTEARANAPEYAVTKNRYDVLSETERLAIRNAQLYRSAAGKDPSSQPVLIAGTKGYTVPTPQIIQRVEVPVDREVIREVIKEVPVDREVIREIPVDREVIKEVQVIKEVVKEVPVIKEVIKEVPVYIDTSTPVLKGPLTDSGPGLVIIVGSSGLTAFALLRRKKFAL